MKSATAIKAAVLAGLTSQGEKIRSKTWGFDDLGPAKGYEYKPNNPGRNATGVAAAKRAAKKRRNVRARRAKK